MRNGNGRKSEFNHTDNQLLTMMMELKVTHNVNLEDLRKAFYTQIKSHHSDKGGNLEKAQVITQAYRILKQYLENNVLLPQPRKTAPSQPAHQQSSSFGRSGCRPNQQAPQSAGDGFKDFGDFQDVKRRRRRKGRGTGCEDGQENGETGGGGGEDEGQGTSNTKNGFGGSKAVPKFVNGYTYDEEDYSKYEDPMERSDRQKDGVRRIRGGLLLYKDFQRNLTLPTEYQEMGSTYTEDDLVDNPEFEPILAKLRTNPEGLHNFAEKLKIYVYISWAFDGGASYDAKMMLQKVRLERVSDDDDSIYEIKVPSKNIDNGMLTSGLHVEVRVPSDGRIWANAVIEQVNPDSQTIVVFFVDPLRLSRILSQTRTVNVAINCSAFVYRSQLRSIEYVVTAKHGRDMEQIIFPKPKFTEQFEEFKQRRALEMEKMPFREDAEHICNEDQKNAIYSIVHKCHHPWPFILFGPPGTGKTITLVEAIRHLVLQSPQNRILVCTPSRMAADNFAELLLQHDFLEHKYIFRMHSLSTRAQNRNKKLDPISYLAKETKNKFFGIPDRLNLKMFRVIISTLATASYLVSAGGLRGYFTHVLVDEAGQANETEMLIPIGGLVGAQTSVILAGDPMQLGPVLNVHSMKYFGYENSMLKRIMSEESYKERSDDRTFVIIRQTYRSHFAILRPCSYLFYQNMLIVDDTQGNFHKLAQWEGLPTKGFPIIFHSSLGSRDVQGLNKSFENQFEAEWVCTYVEKLLNTTDTAEKDIGVIAPYKNQVNKLRHMLAGRPGIRVDSVEGFQGSEREVIIMSMARQRDLGFLRCDLRLNTSISRAKYLLVVIGNEKLLCEHLTWKKFIFYCRFHGGFVNSLGEKMSQIEDGEEEGKEGKTKTDEEEGEEELEGVTTTESAEEDEKRETHRPEDEEDLPGEGEDTHTD